MHCECATSKVISVDDCVFSSLSIVVTKSWDTSIEQFGLHFDPILGA